MMTMQASRYSTKTRTRNICETFQKYPYGWYGDCTSEFLPVYGSVIFAYDCLSSSFSFLFHETFLLCYPFPVPAWAFTNQLLTHNLACFVIAGEEKSKFNSHGLGQIPHFCCSWAGQLSALNYQEILIGQFLFICFFSCSYISFSQVAVVGSLEMPKADLWVIFAIVSTVLGYCAKIYFTYVSSLVERVFFNSAFSKWMLVNALDALVYFFCVIMCRLLQSFQIWDGSFTQWFSFKPDAYLLAYYFIIVAGISVVFLFSCYCIYW